jgi:hypothetical protein
MNINPSICIPMGTVPVPTVFHFVMAKGKVAIQWLDTDDHPLDFLDHPVCEAVPEA